MKKNKTVGIICLVLFAMAVFGGIVNGSLAELGDQNIGQIIGYVGAMGALLVIGIMKLFGKE